MNGLQRFEPQAYALMRIMVGFLFWAHGMQKLFDFPVPHSGAPLWILYVAGSIELVGGALVAIGLLTRPAAFLCSGLMAAGYWMAHGTQGFFPIANGGESAVFFCFAFLFIATHGVGIWGLDAARASAKN